MLSGDRTESRADAHGALQNQLAETIEKRTAGEDDRGTAIANLTFFRREKQAGPTPCLIEPSIVFVAQGAKQLLIGEQAYTYDTERFLIASLDLPGSSQVLEGSPEKPCLGLALRLDLRVISELVAHVRLPAPRERVCDSSAALGTITPALMVPFARLLALLDQPDEIEVLAPLIEREIHFRLLKSDVAGRLLQIASVGSQGHRIARAIDWMKVNYARQLSIEELANYVQMSASSLHHHFRQLTAMSPLQYQKWMRLNEARRLMLNENQDAAAAAFNVGYESPSQFSREYSRLFGAPPKRDIGTLRERAGSAGGRVTANA
ncbi:AraC family transcriptional regulator (plasmid) [Agrobacterium sp. rho-13.3]|uniref:AraC family transcriptional regulator n=1 Tax=Agrobacterium sp. rho-13.3 TaxID=3072980 RepID=UPI002A1838C7|nr:AraC family transcriptional regulator [Agrobacterium sp. rho-13.3]MDX8311889.1 AraC family transcriptional regulator [Agrobacterium sp. rho-13.3]